MEWINRIDAWYFFFVFFFKLCYQNGQKYSNVVVIQHDDELLTPGDAAFTLECDFSKPRDLTVTADLNGSKRRYNCKRYPIINSTHFRYESVVLFYRVFSIIHKFNRDITDFLYSTRGKLCKESPIIILISTKFFHKSFIWRFVWIILNAVLFLL